MRMRCYMNRKESFKKIQSNIMAKATDKTNNEIVLNADSSTSTQHQISGPSRSFSKSRPCKEEEKAGGASKESITLSEAGGKSKSDNKNPSASNYVVQNFYNLGVCASLSSVNTNCQSYWCKHPHFVPRKIIRSLSEVRIHQNFILPNYANYEPNNYRRLHTRRSTSLGSSNSTDVNAKVRRIANMREWEIVGHGHGKKTNHSKHVNFTLMSYNVLAQDLLTEHAYLYRQHNQAALEWDIRWFNIFKEIKQHKADILCLQEVQESHLDIYNKELKNLGYDGMFKKRTGIRTDGCAMFYKRDVFKLMENTTVEFNQTDVSVLNRDNVAIIAKFSSLRYPKNEFVVATTHLLYNPRREDVRLAQTQVLLSELDRISFKKTNGTHHQHLPVILTGDFNLQPHSAVYKLIVAGKLQYENLINRTLAFTNTTYANTTGKYLLPSHLKITDECQHEDLVEKRSVDYSLSREEELRLIQLQHSEREPIAKCAKIARQSLFSTGTLSHHLDLMSAYNHRVGHDTEATTFQDEWITVDYIFYSGKQNDDSTNEGKLKLISRFTIPTTRQLKGITIPNSVFGSDHISLLVKFQLQP